MNYDEKLLAAAAYRRSGMSYRDIGRILRVDKDRIRAALVSQGLADGWGDSPILGSGKSVMQPYLNGSSSRRR